MNNQNIIIYNTASIDSVLSAAWLMQSLKANRNTIAFPASNKIEIDASNQYYWVGVEPATTTLEYFLRRTGHERKLLDKIIPKRIKSFKKQIYHAGFFPENKLNGNGQYFEDIVTPIHHGDLTAIGVFLGKTIETEVEDNCTFETEMLINNCVMRAVSASHPIPVGPAWEIIRLSLAFENNTENLSLRDQATIFKNYNAAVDALAHGGDFGFSLANDEDEKQYIEFLKGVKRQINTMFETSTFVLDGREIQVPTINVNQSLSPWVLKLLSNHYDFAVTYEQRRNNSIFTIFSKFAGFDNYVLKQMRNNKVSCRLSSQL